MTLDTKEMAANGADAMINAMREANMEGEEANKFVEKFTEAMKKEEFKKLLFGKSIMIIY